MFSDFKRKFRNQLHEKLNSYFENFNNKKVIRSYKEILKIDNSKSLKYKKLLIDGHFYNLGYFYRLQLFRAALSSPHLIEHAYIWNYNKSICRNILKSIGIKSITDMSKNNDKSIFSEAEMIANGFKNPIDIINYDFPEEIPGAYVFDVILKKQRSNTVDIKDKNLKQYIYEFLMAIKSSKDLLDEFKPDILAVSHNISFQCTPIVYLAAKRGISTIILSGAFGTPRFMKIRRPNDLFFGIPHPAKEDLDTINFSKKDHFRKIGSECLNKRISGISNELCGQLAHGRGKKKLDIGNLNDCKKTLIAIYSACWFDFPHVFGMDRFVDVLDWLLATIKEASKNKDVLWLLKPHPAEKWYGGLTLEESIKGKLPSNIILLPDHYSGKAVMDVADALVTIHGTSAIEYAAYGKPVLVADKGWFQDSNFVVYPDSREHYLELLKTKWYEKINIQEIKENANFFAGVYFGLPDWQENAILPDDSERELLRKELPEFIDKNNQIINKEISLIKKWLTNDSIDYNTFKVIDSSK